MRERGLFKIEEAAGGIPVKLTWSSFPSSGGNELL